MAALRSPAEAALPSIRIVRTIRAFRTVRTFRTVQSHRLLQGLRGRRPRRVAIALATLLAATGAGSRAWAARPLITDDARIVEPQACQVESWMQFQSGNNQFWALPGCNPTGNLELTLGGAAQRIAGDVRATDIQVQGKTVLKPLDPGGYGVALTLGAIHHVDTEPRRALGNVYLNLPVSVAWLDDRVFTHFNIGATRDTETRSNRMTWGFGTESEVHPRAFLIAEVFGENRGRPSFQAGMRFWMIRDRMQVDTTYGNVFGGDARTRFFTIGIRLLTPAFLR